MLKGGVKAPDGASVSSRLGAFLECRPRVSAVGDKGEHEETPGHLYGHKSVFSCEQSTAWHIFKNLVSSALQFMEILPHILQIDWL